MYRYIASVTLALALMLSLLGGCEEARNPEIDAAYKAYNAAFIARDGAAAVKAVTKASLDAYEPLLKLALDGKEADIKSLAPGYKYEILKMRHHSTRAQLSKLDGAGYLSLATSSGWGDSDGGSAEDIGQLENMDIHDDWAVGYIVLTRKLKVPVYLLKEEGVWKVDEARAMNAVTPLFEEAARFNDMTVDEFILALIEDASGTTPSEYIWRPMIK